MDLISVIVPIYNVEKYIKKCIQSIQEQTYENLEIILVDDGSEDNSLKICEKIAKSDNRVKVLHQNHEGVSASRNAGVEVSNGEYICFVDSDDYVAKNFCEILYNIIKNEDAEISCVNYIEVRENDVPVNSASNGLEKSFDNQIIVYEGIDIVKEMLNWKTFKNMVWNKLYKREILEKHTFKNGKNYEDIFFCYEVLTDIKKLVFINMPCYYYVRNIKSISNTYSEKNLNDFLDIVIERFYKIKEDYSELDFLNHYALLDAIISISIKYVLSEKNLNTVDEKSSIVFNEIQCFIEKNENAFVDMLDDFRKICLYLIKYDKRLFYSFLKERQKFMI